MSWRVQIEMTKHDHSVLTAQQGKRDTETEAQHDLKRLAASFLAQKWTGDMVNGHWLGKDAAGQTVDLSIKQN